MELSGRIVLNRQYFSQIDLSLNKYYQFNQINPFDPEMTRKQSKKSYNIKIFGSCECCGILCSIIFVGAMRSSIVEFRDFFSYVKQALVLCYFSASGARSGNVEFSVIFSVCGTRSGIV